MSRHMLQAAYRRLRGLEGRLVNTGALGVPAALRTRLAREGITLLTPPGKAELPFLCLKGVDCRRLNRALRLKNISFKLFEKLSVLRISCCFRGRLGDTAHDMSADLWAALLQDLDLRFGAE